MHPQRLLLGRLDELGRLADGEWGYWAVGGTHLGMTGLFGPHIGSFENRATALYRHFAGIPEDQEPPAAKEE